MLNAEEVDDDDDDDAERTELEPRRYPRAGLVEGRKDVLAVLTPAKASEWDGRNAATDRATRAARANLIADQRVGVVVTFLLYSCCYGHCGCRRSCSRRGDGCGRSSIGYPMVPALLYRDGWRPGPSVVPSRPFRLEILIPNGVFLCCVFWCPFGRTHDVRKEHFHDIKQS